jgi:hypothetical protein
MQNWLAPQIMEEAQSKPHPSEVPLTFLTAHQGHGANTIGVGGWISPFQAIPLQERVLPPDDAGGLCRHEGREDSLFATPFRAFGFLEDNFGCEDRGWPNSRTSQMSEKQSPQWLAGMQGLPEDVAPDSVISIPSTIESSFLECTATTLMVRNVPIRYKQHMLANEWPNNGTYDLLYLPFNTIEQRNLTYAFINFTSPAAAVGFAKQWQKNRLAHFTARKPLNISYADVQGRDENLLQFKKKRLWRVKVNDGEPLIFENGIQVPLAQALDKLNKNQHACNRMQF